MIITFYYNETKKWIIMNMKQWENGRYYSLNYYLKETYGEKLYKISLNGGMTCPNRDGKIDTRGCIFCSAGGSGDFAGNVASSITEQLTAGKSLLTQKTSTRSYIAYFQAFTNTYAPIEHLRRVYYEAIADPEVRILSIATRPDCLSLEVLELLEEIQLIKPVWIELGLQSSCEASAQYIRRGYSLPVFEQAVSELNQRKIPIIVHTIMGLPSEPKDGILDTISYLNTCNIQGIKLQLLHVLEGTDLALHFRQEPFFSPTLPEFLELLGKCITHLRPDIVIHRITGDGPKDLLIEPQWTASKRYVLNSINKYLKQEDIWQGKYYPQGGTSHGRSDYTV